MAPHRQGKYDNNLGEICPIQQAAEVLAEVFFCCVDMYNTVLCTGSDYEHGRTKAQQTTETQQIQKSKEQRRKTVKTAVPLRIASNRSLQQRMPHEKQEWISKKSAGLLEGQDHLHHATLFQRQNIFHLRGS